MPARRRAGRAYMRALQDQQNPLLRSTRSKALGEVVPRRVPAPVMSLAEFVREAWPSVETKALRWGRHLDMICGALERVSAGEIKRLAINIPPGYSKSLLVNVFWPCWMWSQGHTTRFLCSAGVSGLAIRDALKTRKLLESAWYQARWDTPYRRSANGTGYFELVNGASRRAISKGSRTTGHRGDILVNDDLLTAMEVYSKARLRHGKDWFNTEFLSRTDDEDSPVVVIGQRLHEDDIFADLLAQGGWTFIVLPSEFDPQLAQTAHTYDQPDWRQVKGELLHPERFSAASLAAAARAMGRLNYAAQHGQRPSAIEGGVVRRDDFRRYKVAPPLHLLDACALVIDASFEGDDGSDRVSLQMWGRQGVNAYLLQELVSQLTFTETISAIHTMLGASPHYRNAEILIERKANGHALLNILRAQLPNLRAFVPKTSKTARLISCTPALEAGQVWVPDERWWTWVQDCLDEWCAFPRGRYDDRVDTLSMILIHWFGRARVGFAEQQSATGPRLE